MIGCGKISYKLYVKIFFFFGLYKCATNSFCFFFLVQNQMKTKKRFSTLNLNHIWCGTAMCTATAVRGLILLWVFGPPALKVAHPWIRMLLHTRMGRTYDFFAIKKS